MRFFKRSTHNACGGIRPLLSPYIDGRTTPQETQDVERHLATCVSCRNELAQLRVVVQGLRALPAMSAPRSFAIRPAMVHQAQAIRPSGLLYLRRAAVTLAACLLLTVGIGSQLGETTSSAVPASVPGPQRMVASQAQSNASSGQPLKAQSAGEANPATTQAPQPLGTPVPPTAPAAAAAAQAPAFAPPSASEPSAVPGAPAAEKGIGGAGAPQDQASAPEGPAQPAATPAEPPASRGEAVATAPARWPLRELEIVLAISLLLVSVGAFLGERVSRP